MRRSVTIDELDKLQIDDATGYIYWDGTRIVTESVLSLPFWVNVAIIVTALATLGMCIVMWISYFQGKT